MMDSTHNTPTPKILVRGLTLAELLIAISLLSFILLVIAGIDISARRLLGATDRQTVTLMDISPAMDHMEKWLSLAIGDKNNPGISVVSASEIQFRNAAGNPSDYNDDIWRRYWLADNSLQYDPDIATPGNEEILGRRVNNINFIFYPPQNYVSISIEARYDPAQAASADNPVVILQSNISPRCRSSN